jgi:hypothetical protein
MKDDRKPDGQNSADQHAQPTPRRPVIVIDTDRVPPELHPIIPHAEKWGITDSELLLKRMDEASVEELKELDDAVTPFLKALRAFAYGPTVNPESFIFNALHNAKRIAWPKVVIWSNQAPNPRINPDHVPPELQSLIPYAEKWGIPDRVLQDKLLRDAPVQEIVEMYEMRYPLWDEVWQFTETDLPREHPTSYSVAVFTCFRDSFNVVVDILVDNMPEKWLEIVGWPESFPVMPYDPAKIPVELQPLIPYIEKWVRNDDGVRFLALDVAPHQEHDELLSACDQIGGDRVIRSIVSDMVDEKDGTLTNEGYVIALLMDMVEHVRIQKR